MVHHTIEKMSDFKYGTAACVVVLDEDGCVLAIARKSDPNTPSALPGGKRDCDETYEEAAVREAFEETGISVYNLRKIYEGPCRNDKNKDEYNTVTFLADYHGIPFSKEGLAVGFIPWETLLDGAFGMYNRIIYDVLCPVIIDINDEAKAAS